MFGTGFFRKTKKQQILGYEGDYSYIYRRKSPWELLRLSCTIMGIEFTYSALTAFVSPVLLELGIDYKQMTFVWAVSPVIGFFLSPVIGSISDRCTLSYGRRRPFILLFSFLNVLGLLLIPYGESIGNTVDPIYHMDHIPNKWKWKFKPGSTANTWAIFITIIGVVIADYTSDALQSPSRAYLLDVCNTDDHSRGLTAFTIVAGFGGFIGYLLGSLDWNNIIVLDGLFDNHIKPFYALVTIVFIICIIVTVTTFKEVPLNRIYPAEIKKVSMLDNGMLIDIPEHTEKSQLLTKNGSYGSLVTSESLPKISSTPSLSDYIKSIIVMPYSLRILCFTNLLCWMCHMAYSLYFTDFVGEVVFGGDPSAPPESKLRVTYDKGVRFACVGMSLYSLSCMCYSFALEKLIVRFGLRTVYIGGILTDAVSLLLMVVFKSKFAIIILSATCGILYSTVYTIPYILLAHYHSLNVFEVDSNGYAVPHRQIRGLGTDISIVGSCVFAAQFILSLLIGQIVSLVGNTSAVMGTASFLACCASLVATKVVYLDM